MLYILSNINNDIHDLSTIPTPDMVVYVVYSNMPKNKTMVKNYGNYCSRNNILFNICYIVGEKYKPTFSSLEGIGSMYHKGTILVL